MLREAFRSIRGVKVNFTDVRISAMEDFVGRGDRRLASVVQRAWELGAGMDSWWESLDKAFGAWTQAIDESGLTWKYRQVESGEWNVFDSTEHSTIDAPLPWDHLDTGIDKKWLKEDLQRALEAAIVPDCSFEGCSHCGVCGVDFGHNIVIPPMPIPQFEGHFQPNQNRAQRLRVRLGKHGEMALLSHLDLLRLLDRVIRRAAIPIAFTGGFHPSPRISPANALPLGVTSSSEIVDFELVETMSITEFRQRLTAQLPAEIPVYDVEEVSLQTPAATQLLEKAEYQLTLDSEFLTSMNLQNWIEKVLSQSELWLEQTTKSGKTYPIDVRDRLFDLDLTEVSSEGAKIRYVGSCRNDGTFLRPEQIVTLLEQVAHQEIRLLNIHRLQLFLTERP